MTTPQDDPGHRPQQPPAQQPAPQEPSVPTPAPAPPSFAAPPPPPGEADITIAVDPSLAHAGAHSAAAHSAAVEPREVRLSYWLWITAAVLLVLSSALVLTQRDAAIDAARQVGGTRGLTEEQFQAAVTASLMFITGIGVVLGALMVFFAVKARRGRGWARIALTVLGAAVFLYHLLGASLAGLLIVLVVAAAVVTMYLPASKQYFDAVKRAG